MTSEMRQAIYKTVKDCLQSCHRFLSLALPFGSVAKRGTLNWPTRHVELANAARRIGQRGTLSFYAIAAPCESKGFAGGATAGRHKGLCPFNLLLAVLLMLVGGTKMWGQAPFTLTTSGDVTNGTEKLYWMESKGAVGFFAIPHTDDTRLSTSNMANMRMLWYFMDAGEVSGTQYYYVVNKSTGKYMKLVGSLGSNNTIQIANYSAGDDEKFKFSIGSNEGAWVLFPKSGGTSYWVNKQSGSVPYNKDNTQGWFKASNYNKTIDDNSRWYFRAKDAITWAHPFTNSAIDGDKHYYFIQNKKSTSYYVSTHNGYASVTNTRNNNSIWYFVEAASDETIPNLKYYYIVNASTDKRMYFNSETLTGDQLKSSDNAVDVRDYVGGENEDRYQFAILDGFSTGYTNGYIIVPKKLIGLYYFKYTALGASSMSNNSHLGTLQDRGQEQNTAHWGLVATEYPMRCVTPTITFNNSTGKVTITTSPAGSAIHYTTDGETNPTSSSGTSYSSPFTITEQTTVKAIASLDGYVDSEVATKTFYKVATPIIQDNGDNTVSITCATEGVTIYFTTDGSTPTTSSTEYAGPLTDDVSGKTIKAIAVKSGMISSAVGSGSVTMQCAKPVFTKTDATHLTITCSFPTSGVTIKYIKNGGEAEPNVTYSGAITVAKGDVIKALAIAEGYSPSEVATKKIFDELVPTAGKYLITSQEEFENFIDMASTEDGAGKHYVLQLNVTAGSEIPQTFTGTFDGGMHTISGLSGHALFNSITGGTVKNVMLDNVSVSGTNAGAIANVATGDSRIYNCGVLSGSVSGSNRAGSIVGSLEGSSRVINCFSFANVSGGAHVGGIVGYNNGITTAADIQTMVMNCAFYGDITGGSTVSPVYGGNNINNLHDGLNTYNYYAYDRLKTTEVSTDKYNCALGVEDVFLTRFETYRQLLNSNRRLAAKYATREGAPVSASDMAKWVLETADRSIANPKPYPVLKTQAKYPSIINYDTRGLATYSEANRNQGLQIGTLDVTISGVGSNAPTGASITNSSLTLVRTDKDFGRFNFNYDKVQLPYYNDVGEGNYTGNKVVTGWKITGMSGGTSGTYQTGDKWGGYNFADRNCTNKDLYGQSGRVFAQGAYFDVPYGVTSITIEPYWGQAAYVADEYMDVVYSIDYNLQNVSQLGKAYGANGVEASINGSTQIVYNSIANAVGALSSGGTVYDHAVVLVGNVHLAANPPTDSKSFTIMSADLDFDNEPDNSFIFGHNNRQAISPVRFDFLNMPGIAMAQKPNGATTFRNVSIFNPKGWFEITNTCITRLVQMEYDNGGKSAAPVIIQGGIVDQFVSTKTSEPKVTTYLHVGGNAWFKDFGNGTHSDGSQFTPHIPISVTGGDFDAFYLSGTYKPEAAVKADNAECYISGGRFGEVAGAGQQKIDGNVRWQIYDADISNFYGGGINFNNPVTGNIQTDIVNSHVGTFCGGPKFGDMTANKTVITNATGCTFDKYFGAGYGGISYNRIRTRDVQNATSSNFNTWKADYTGKRGKYLAENGGVATDFDYEFFVWSTGVVGARFYVKYASLSTAKTNDVTSTLTSCTINNNFYGGGSLGNVNGKATSVLENCTVEGNVFGGGFSASKPKVPIRTTAVFNELPDIDKSAGVFDMGEPSETEDFTLVQGSLSDNSLVINESEKTIITNVDLTTLGLVTETDLTIKGNTIVRGKIFNDDGSVKETTGGVFGGGDMSAVHNNTLVDIQSTDGTSGVLNVFGGGNTADVGGNTEVKMTGGKVSQSVYGGGKGQTTTVAGDVLVNIGTRTGNAPSFTYTGSGTVAGNVYGGSALGAVNATKNPSAGELSYTTGKKTEVNIYSGTVNGSVFGGGLGHDDENPAKDIVAQNFGPTAVTVENSVNANACVKTAVYGGSNENGVLKQTATVTITGGTVGTAGGDLKNIVFGGGFGQPTLINDNVTVNVGASGQISDGAICHGNIYGGSALGGVNVTNISGTPTADTKTDVNLYKGTINGNVYGGGLGQKNGVNGATSDIAAIVGGDVNVLLNGAKLNCTYTGEGENRMPVMGQIFGCNNLNGTPKGHVKVWVKKTVGSEKPGATPRESRTTYDVAAVYGGGNQADYIPTKALSETEAVRNQAFAQVVIEGCDQTSIEYVYGGGNAAAVPATDVTILGDYIINYVFGGGNGKSTATFTNPGANVGIYNNNGTPTNYGTGKAVTKLVGGHINYVFGGSNTKGNVRGGTTVTMPDVSAYPAPTYDCCNIRDIKEIYGAGNEAEQDGAVTLILGCVNNMDYVYGGAKKANVKGGVDLVVTSGHFRGVYGGNDTSGSIEGPITLTIEETGCDPLIIDELYLGGKQAPYSIYGYKDVEGTLTARTKTEYDLLTTEQKTALGLPYANPILNIVSCTGIGNVFGGGFEAAVYGSPTVNINQIPGEYAAQIDRDGDDAADNNTSALGTIGNVYGGGSAADVYGNTMVNIGTASTVTLKSIDDDSATLDVDERIYNVEGARIIGNVYGGGLAGNIEGGTNVNIGTKNYTTDGYERVIIEGNVFGGGQGATTKVTGSVAVAIGEKIAGEGDEPDTYNGNAAITGDVYGGSALGSVNADGSPLEVTDGATTVVTLNTGAITGSVYGGGLGDKSSLGEGHADVAANVYGSVTVNINNGTVSESVYGCNNLNGSPQDDVSVVIAGGTITESVYGGGNLAAYNGAGALSVSVSGGSVTDAFGGGLGTTAVVTGNTSVSISGGSVTRDVYGGGSEAEVIGGTTITLSDRAAVTHDVYGGGKEAGVTGAVTVALNGGTVGNDVYGGGALAQTNTSYAVGSAPSNTYVTAVTLAGSTVTGIVYGGGLGRQSVAAEGLPGDPDYVPAVSAVAANVNGPVTVTVSSGQASNVFGCNNINGAPLGTVVVNINGGTITNSIFGGGNQAAYDGSPTVNVTGGTINYNVFGGGNQADVAGSVAVNISGGEVKHDVYGGGALSNTNTANWDETKLVTTYEKITATLTAGTSSVAGLYKKDGENYILQAPNSKAENGAEYYRRFDTAWAEGKTSASNTTNVILTGGKIGNVFGGGLGDLETPVYVYGDVTINVNKTSDMATHGGTGAILTRELAQNIVVDGANYASIPITGSIFGANNFNGSPKGNVTVEIFKTKRVDGGAHVLGDYEVQGVYGGGNLANYLPATGKETKVIIHGCSDTSIEYVYGGGNSASVPSTDVTIYGAFDIGYAFGGGNGSKPVKNSVGTWVANGGAMVTGDANISARGGRIGQVFGGSDAKGDILGNSNADITTTTGQECTLTLTRLFGAGNEADVAGDVNLILSGCSSDNVQYVHGGSYNAHITGDVNLTITSGYYTNVFGGNDARGSIGGHITVNVEETDDCKPVVIRNLVGGGNEAPYPGKKKDGSEYATPGKVTVNIKSATRIDKVYGGGYKADVKGDTEVNINMMKGSKAGAILSRPESYTGDVIPNVHVTEGITYINDAIGTIGDVYGGGNEGNVIGSTTVNIGTASKIKVLRREGGVPGGALLDASGNHVYDVDGKVIKDGDVPRTVAEVDADVRGANITGDVFGGGNLAYVTGNTTVNISTVDLSAKEDVSIGKSVYGGGNSADVHGNTNVTMSGGYVFNGIFGGGYSGSVGTFTRSTTPADVNIFGHTSHAGICLGKPVSCAPGTGLCTVVVNGGQIGPVTVATDGMPVPQGWVWGGGYGLVEDPEKHPDTHFITYVDSTDVTIGGTAFIMEGVIGGGEFGRVLRGTHVTIEGDCQIGVGMGQTEAEGTLPKRYTDGQFIDPTVTPITVDNALNECAHWPYGEDTDDDGVADKFNCLPYDPYYDTYPTALFSNASTLNPSDGTTWIGVVFGGGSGYMPYIKDDRSGYDWCRSAGRVDGNTKLEIKGGHILTNVYGANEYTDVGGNAIVRMTGGTIGVPRTEAQIVKTPTLGCLFGAGKGDQRTYFNTWTNVQNVDVEVTGGIIYGSVYGGGEEGHVLGDVKMTIGGTAVVGSCGTSYFDGNVFGGGRGYSGRALTAGSVGGNVTLNIAGGKMLGSVYGGGRVASVGTYFANVDDTRYGNFKEDDGDGTYGHVTVNINGGEIGNDEEPITKPHTTGGNVFGGCMGRLTHLDGTANEHWAQLAQAKTATVNITGNSTLIKGNVYGGGEFGTVRDHAYVTIGGTLEADKETVDTSKGGAPTLLRDVYGGGYGYGNISEDANYTASVSTTYLGREHIYTYTPMKFAGCVGKSTLVNIAGGWVKKNVYGGGEMASVGIINYETEPASDPISDDRLKAEPDGSTQYMYITKHAPETNTFFLSWPYEVTYITGYEGTSTVKVTGGRVGITGKDSAEEGWGKTGDETKIDNGDIFGGCKGSIGDRYDVAFCGNVRNTVVNINYTSSTANPTNYKTGVDYSNKNEYDCVTGSVYGGGENGHVIGNTSVTLADGLIGHSIYGGGKGKDKFEQKLVKFGSTKNPVTGLYSDADKYDANAYDITAGKVYGTTTVSMTGGTVVRNIYGGGNMASVGKGNYAGGSDDYATGYGEKITTALWSNTDFTESGITNVTITDGQVGYIDSDPSKSIKDDLPYGNVFGGCRGQGSAEVPGIEFNPDFYVGYVNETNVTIGDGSGGPTIYGSVYGGGQDGHVRRDTKVTINDGVIGQSYNVATGAIKALPVTDIQWLHRGNVYGGGSGIGKYEFDYDGNGSTWTDADSDEKYDEGEENSVSTAYGLLKERGFSSSAGSVTRNSSVEIKGGTIHHNVYGGGSLASVLPTGWIMGTGPYTDAAKQGKVSVNTVDISGGTIGSLADYGFDYGGNVFGASRGMYHADINSNYFALAAATQVNIKNTYDGEGALDASPHIFGNVYGGGEMGIVKQNTNVQLTGGTIDHDAYGGGKGTANIAADVGGDVLLELNNNNDGETAIGTVEGCVVSRLYGCNDFNGTPKGHVKVHVYATQNSSKSRINSKFGRRPALGEKDHKDETIVEYLKRLLDAAAAEGVSAKITASVVTAANTTWTDNKDKATLLQADSTAINTAIENMQEELCKLYDVQIVYGGGNLAAYEPTDAYSADKTKKENARTQVIIDGCSLTSIRQVYGSGNAASTPATYLRVNGCYEIDEVYGGGNGKDDYQIGNTYYKNPGANVGYSNFMHYVKSGEVGYDLSTHGAGSLENPYKAITNTNATNKDLRQANYLYGSGIATTEVVGGRIHNVYGGSNQRGNISTMALSAYQESGTCELVYDVAYNAGKNAEIDGEARITLDCVKEGGTVYGGATNADMNSNVTLNITNGSFTKIFGGNNLGGRLNGSITINVQENGCKPIHIDELFGGGNQAAYSIYGYYNAGTKETPNYKPRTKEKFQADSLAVIATVVYPDGADEATKAQVRRDSLISAGLYGLPYASPLVNVVSATEIGTIYGGGYKADVVGNPSINVNMENGKILAKYMNDEDFSVGSHTVDGKTYYVERLGEAVTLEGGGTKNTGILRIGTIGTIFGGGDEANILGDTHVDIGTGKGYNLDGTVNDELTRNAAFITGSVYGGGKKGHVGNFTFTDGKPTSCAEGTGTCYVTISHGDIGPDNMQMTAVGGPDDAGHVFGAGQGYLADPDVDATVDFCAYADYTEVTIDGDAFIKGSVYGGSENGHVLHDTHVTIDGNCQIGNGNNVNRRYTSEEWAYDVTANPSHYLAECAHWDYGAPFQPHDKFANAGGGYEPEGSVTATDGHTFYGNVFGGGSGYYPYAAGKWLKKAGWVEGNTVVEIKGGHILTNVYGGNEMTNVGTGLSGAGGKSTVRMTGGTLGVPRTLAQIAAHPVTCYLFGAGKGDQNIHFNKDTNVKEVEIEITGGKIYGSVFGGGEDGHVLGDVKMTIGNDDGTGPTIGTWGTSYVDGNVFGGGRGFSGEALTAGNVGGSVRLDVKGGKMLGSVYGGGRLGSVGYGLYDVDDDDNYGVMRDNDKDDAGTATTYYTTTGLNKKGRGNVNINISGGTIGNNHEYKYIDPATSIDDSYRSTNHTPFTEFDANNRLLHTKGGNVFAGGMGRRTALDESVLPNWYKLGNVKSTKLTISGGDTWIMGNVYGGGEYGAVTGSHDTKNTANDDIQAGTEIIINGGTIGTQITTSGPEKEVDLPGTYPTSGNSSVQYTFGSVYGGGYGTEAEIASITANAQVDKLGAMVADSTYINMTTGLVRASVFGGGEIAAVGGSTNVNISGGEIGRNEVRAKGDPDDPGYVKFGSSTMGNVFGGGKGTDSHTLVGIVKGNTTINITPGAVAGEPKIYHNVYSGGAYGSVGTFLFSDGVGATEGFEFMAKIPKGIPLSWTAGTGIARVNIKGGTIGISGRDNGMVNGSSRGDVAKPILTQMAGDHSLAAEGHDGYVYKDPYDKMAWVEKSFVTIGDTLTPGPHIKGSVYGGGENGHVFTHATVNVMSGTIGVLEGDTWYDFGNESINKGAWITRGNVYGAGCGTDTYTGDDGKKHHNPWAGCVIGNTDIKISGGLVAQSVYGGGSMGSVGRIDETKTTPHTDVSEEFALSWPVAFAYDVLSSGTTTGKATVNIYGGRIGTTGSDNGDVFGGTRGEAGPHDKIAQFGNVRETAVNIKYTNPATVNDLVIVENVEDVEEGKKFSLRVNEGVNAITGSVYGGGENGHVNENTNVKVENGLIGHAVYGGGKGKGTYIPTGETKAVSSITAGKVYGNTSITMTGGHVVRNVYGGGNLGSVGKGNYAGGLDDYYPDGYGEKIDGNLWTPTEGFNPDSPITNSNKPTTMADYFLSSGKTNVNVTGGTVGFLATTSTPIRVLNGDGISDLSFTERTYAQVLADAGKKKALIKVMSKDGLPTGNIFGGCRGQAAAEVMSLVFNETNPDFFLGYVNATNVSIGDGDSGPTIYGSVYGGGQDGHVRRSTNVIVNKGAVGVAYTADNQTLFGTDDLDNTNWIGRGNVYGGGSGIGMYDTGEVDAEDNPIMANSSSAGSVTHTTTVTVNSGIDGSASGVIHRNVYGGGSYASVGPPAISLPNGPYADLTGGLGRKFVNTVSVSGTIGTPTDFVSGFKYNKMYGGEVYGASRGIKGIDPAYADYFGASVWTKVFIKNGARILNNVYGGGDAGKVRKDSEVIVGEDKVTP